MHISDQYCLRAVLYCVYRCCLANIETILGLFYKTHINEIRKILLNCFISLFNLIRLSCLHVLISVLSKNKRYITQYCARIVQYCQNRTALPILSNINSIQKESRNHETHKTPKTAKERHWFEAITAAVLQASTYRIALFVSSRRQTGEVHFAWAKSTMYFHPLLGRPTGLLSFAFASKACFGSLSSGILLTWLNHQS